MIVLLDAGPLGLITNPRATIESQRCKRWLVDLLGQGIRVLVPEITDYEVRRELLRAGRLRGVAHLDQFKTTAGYVPLTTPMMLQAAAFWAQARQQGQPTAPDLALDADVILAAQAVVLARQGEVLTLPPINRRGFLAQPVCLPTIIADDCQRHPCPQAFSALTVQPLSCAPGYGELPARC